MSSADQQQAVADRLDRFATAYSTLSRLWAAPPDAELLAFLAQPGQLDEWPMERDEATTQGLALMAEALSGTPDAEAIEFDYQQLFIGPGRPHAVPYESVYLGKEGLLYEEPTFEVRRAYEAFGVAAPDRDREPDDHIALELSFLAHLCVQALDALERGDDMNVDRCLAGEQAFLADHALRWMPTVIDSVLEKADTGFYRSLGLLTRGVLQQGSLDE